MEINWHIVYACLLVNTAWLSVQRGLSCIDNYRGLLPRRHTIIEGTEQKFLYMEDFASNTWGDLLGLPAIQIAFAHLWWHGQLGLYHWLVVIVVAPLAGLCFRQLCLSKAHKPDYGFPRTGQSSWSGEWHIPYLGLNCGIAAVVVPFVPWIDPPQLGLWVILARPFTWQHF